MSTWRRNNKRSKINWVIKVLSKRGNHLETRITASDKDLTYDKMELSAIKVAILNLTSLARIESRDFYELCQQYRHCTVDAALEFELIKEYIRTGNLPWPSYEEEA